MKLRIAVSSLFAAFLAACGGSQGEPKVPATDGSESLDPLSTYAASLDAKPDAERARTAPAASADNASDVGAPVATTKEAGPKKFAATSASAGASSTLLKPPAKPSKSTGKPKKKS